LCPVGSSQRDGIHSNKIVQINPTTHAIAEFPIPTADSNPSEITTGPDSSLHMS
jgi:hypothetical protein